MKALILDTETTGLIDNHTIKIDKQPEVIEYYGCAVDLVTGNINQELSLLIKPSRPSVVTDEITRITGLKYDDLKEAPGFMQVANEIFGQIEKAPAIIAHNLSYDKEMLEIEAERLGRKINWPSPLICTVEQTVHLKGYRLNLSDMHEMLFGVRFDGAHRAKVDVQALTKCCVELKRRGML